MDRIRDGQHGYCWAADRGPTSTRPTGPPRCTPRGRAAHIHTHGATPLYIASEQGKTDTVELLISKRADINKAEKDGATPLYVASGKGKTDTVSCSYPKGPTSTRPTSTSHPAASHPRRRNGVTPLYVASQKGKTDTVELLISKGADINKAMKNGNTPLIIAAYKNHMAVVRVLVKKRRSKHHNPRQRVHDRGRVGQEARAPTPSQSTSPMKPRVCRYIQRIARVRRYDPFPMRVYSSCQ